MKHQVVYIISDIHKSLAFEWTALGLRARGIEPAFILLNSSPHTALQAFLQAHRFRVTHYPLHGKKSYPRLWWQLFFYLRRHRPLVVHTHLFDASLLGLSAAKAAGIRQRIYTRHHSTFHHEYFPRAVWYDRLLNALATDIVAISRNVEEVLCAMEKVPKRKVHLIHHGFDLQSLAHCSQERVEAVRRRHAIPAGAFPVVGVIARYTELKGIQHIIPAFARVLTQYPKAHLVLANARGNYAATIHRLLQKHLPSKNYTEIPFEEDLAALYRLFHVYVHVPVNARIEAFGQTYVEALACGIPSVFTLSGIAHDFIVHEENAWVVPYRNHEAITEGMHRLLTDQVLRQKVIKNGQKKVAELFDLGLMLDRLQALYRL